MERGAVGIPYFSSSVRQHPATAVTQPGQPATPKMTASPFCLDFLPQIRGVVPEYESRLAFQDGFYGRHVLGQPRLELLHEKIASSKTLIHQVHGLAVQTVQPRRHRPRWDAGTGTLCRRRALGLRI